MKRKLYPKAVFDRLARPFKRKHDRHEHTEPVRKSRKPRRKALYPRTITRRERTLRRKRTKIARASRRKNFALARTKRKKTNLLNRRSR